MKTFLFLLFPLLMLGQTPGNLDIFEAIRQGNTTVVKQQVGADPDLANQINSRGHSLLIVAAYYGQKEIVDILLPVVDNIDHKSEEGTALAAAVVKNQVPIVEALLKYKADPDITDANGVTPLMYALIFRNKPAITLLMNSGANIDLKDNTGKSTFEYALATNNQEFINLIKH